MTPEEARRQDMVVAINDTIVRDGFATLKMDKIANIMGVSRGKLYQYYPSKDAVIEAVVARYQAFMNTQAITQYVAGDDLLQAFPQAFLNALTLIGSSSDVFRRDLAHFYPELFNDFNTAYEQWLTGLTDFLAAGRHAGVFNETLNPSLFVIQTEATVPFLMDQQILASHHLFIDGVLHDYFKMIVNEVVVPSRQIDVPTTNIAEPLNHLINKYQHAFN